MPGVRDRHSGCVCSYLVEHDLFDFLLLSLPDNDWYSHKRGPEGQVHSIAQADLQLARVMNAGGGVERVPRRARDDRHGRPLPGARDARRSRSRTSCRSSASWPRRRQPGRAPRAASRGSPSAPPSGPRWSMRCDEDERDAMRASVVGPRAGDRRRRPRDVARARRPRGSARGRAREPRARRAALRPRAARCRIARGRRWSVEGALEVLGGHAAATGVLLTPDYPDALARAWSALHLSHLRRGAAVGRARLRVHRLGPPGARRRRQPRLPARQRLARARCCSAASALPERGAGPVGDPRRRPAGARALRRAPSDVPLASTRSETPAAGSALRCARAGPPRRRPSRVATVKPRPETPVPGRALEHADGAGTTLSSATGAGDRERGAEGPRSAPRAARAPTARSTQGPASLAGELLLARAGSKETRPGDHRRPRRAGAGSVDRASRSPGRWPAATRAPSASTSTRCTSGCPCACCSCSRSSTSAGRCRCCTSTCSCCCRSRSRWRSSTTPTSTPRSRSPTLRCSTCWHGCCGCCAGAPRVPARRAPCAC